MAPTIPAMFRAAREAFRATGARGGGVDGVGDGGTTLQHDAAEATELGGIRERQTRKRRSRSLPKNAPKLTAPAATWRAYAVSMGVDPVRANKSARDGADAAVPVHHGKKVLIQRVRDAWAASRAARAERGRGVDGDAELPALASTGEHHGDESGDFDINFPGILSGSETGTELSSEDEVTDTDDDEQGPLGQFEEFISRRGTSFTTRELSELEVLWNQPELCVPSGPNAGIWAPESKTWHPPWRRRPFCRKPGAESPEPDDEDVQGHLAPLRFFAKFFTREIVQTLVNCSNIRLAKIRHAVRQKEIEARGASMSRTPEDPPAIITALKNDARGLHDYQFAEVKELDILTLAGILLIRGSRRQGSTVKELFQGATGVHKLPGIESRMSESRVRGVLFCLRGEPEPSTVVHHGQERWAFERVRELFNQACLEEAPGGTYCSSVTLDEHRWPYKGRYPEGAMKRSRKKLGQGFDEFMICVASGSFKGYRLIGALDLGGGPRNRFRQTKVNVEELCYSLIEEVSSALGDYMHVCADNRFTSKKLSDALFARRVYLSGTTRRQAGVKGAPRAAKESFSMLIDRGQFTEWREVSTKNAQLACYAWRDTECTMAFSSYFDPAWKDRGRATFSVSRTSKEFGAENNYVRDIPCPEAYKWYNENKGGVDIFSQLCYGFSVAQKHKKWTIKVGFYGLLDSCVTQAFILRRGWQRVRRTQIDQHAQFCASLAMLLLGYKAPRQAAAEMARLWGTNVPATGGSDDEDDGPQTPRPVRWGAERRQAVHESFGRQIERSRGLEESHFLASTGHLDSLSRQTVQAWLPTTCAQCNRERTSGTRRASSRPATFCTGCGARLCVKCFFPWHMDRNLSSGEVLSLARRWSQSTDIRRPERRRMMRTQGMQQDEGSSSQSSEGTVSEGP